jgi:hypothetical protein
VPSLVEVSITTTATFAPNTLNITTFVLTLAEAALCGPCTNLGVDFVSPATCGPCNIYWNVTGDYTYRRLLQLYSPTTVSATLITRGTEKQIQNVVQSVNATLIPQLQQTFSTDMLTVEPVKSTRRLIPVNPPSPTPAGPQGGGDSGSGMSMMAIIRISAGGGGVLIIIIVVLALTAKPKKAQPQKLILRDTSHDQPTTQSRIVKRENSKPGNTNKRPPSKSGR